MKVAETQGQQSLRTRCFVYSGSPIASPATSYIATLVVSSWTYSWYSHESSMAFPGPIIKKCWSLSYSIASWAALAPQKSITWVTVRIPFIQVFGHVPPSQSPSPTFATCRSGRRVVQATCGPQWPSPARGSWSLRAESPGGKNWRTYQSLK